MAVKLFIFFVTSLICFEIHCQNFIGLHKNEIIDSMKISYKNFKLNNDVVNKAYKYLKFEDHVSEQTMLFFLSEDNRCTLVRWMSDYSNINDIIGQLNKKYSKISKNQWSYNVNGKDYIVMLEDGEWYFTVTIKKK